jgi:hypothetical protein
MAVKQVATKPKTGGKCRGYGGQKQAKRTIYLIKTPQNEMKLDDTATKRIKIT